MNAETIIMGAGPAGLAAGACLRQKGRDFMMVDRASELGSAWRSHYDRLRLHTAKRHSALPHRPFPRDWPRYVPREQFVAYLEDYARAFELTPRLGEAVTQAEPTEGGWRVVTSAGTHEARNLIVATGYNAVPYVPSIPGADAFRGATLHSADYRNAEPYRGKRMLVVGAGNTGAELALDLSENGAASVDLCVRSPVHIVERDIFGMPAQVLAILASWIPVSVRDVLFAALVRMTVGDLERFGVRAPAEGIVARVARIGRVPIVDVGTVALIKSGRIHVRPDVRELTERGAAFAEGSFDYDAIVFATGFRPRLDAFLACADRIVDDRGYPRTCGREAEIPGLYFVGFHNTVTGLLREIGIEAKRVARSIANRSEVAGGV